MILGEIQDCEMFDVLKGRGGNTGELVVREIQFSQSVSYCSSESPHIEVSDLVAGKIQYLEIVAKLEGTATYHVDLVSR